MKSSDAHRDPDPNIRVAAASNLVFVDRTEETVHGLVDALNEHSLGSADVARMQRMCSTSFDQSLLLCLLHHLLSGRFSAVSGN